MSGKDEAWSRGSGNAFWTEGSWKVWGTKEQWKSIWKQITCFWRKIVNFKSFVVSAKFISAWVKTVYTLSRNVRRKLSSLFSAMVCHRTWDSFYSFTAPVLVAACRIVHLCYDMWDLFVVACGIQFPDQGSNLQPLHWEHRVLATGPPAKSPDMGDCKWKLIFLCSFFKAFILPYSFLYILPSLILCWIYYSVKTKPFPWSVRPYNLVLRNERI